MVMVSQIGSVVNSVSTSPYTSVRNGFADFYLPWHKKGVTLAVPTEKQKEKVERHYGKQVVFAGLALGLTTLATTIALKRFSKHGFQELLKTAKQAGESIPNNMINYRDTFVKKPMYAWTPTRKIHQGITKLWLNIGKITVERSHANTIKKFNKLCASIDGADANKILEKIDKEVISGLNGKHLQDRFDTMYKSLDDLEEFFLKTPLKTLLDKDLMVQLLSKHKANEMIIGPRKLAGDSVKPLSCETAPAIFFALASASRLVFI